MEEYFKAARVPEGEKVRITSMYLTGDANKLWWRRRMEDDAYAGRPTIERWEVLKKELKDQFLPCKTAWVARDSLKKLKHTGTVREYVKEFSSLMLDIKNMSEENKLFNFMSGLQSWVGTDGTKEAGCFEISMREYMEEFHLLSLRYRVKEGDKRQYSSLLFLSTNCICVCWTA